MNIAQAIKLWTIRFLEPLAATKDRYARRQIFTAMGIDGAVDIEELLEEVGQIVGNLESTIQTLLKQDLDNLNLNEIPRYLNEIKELVIIIERISEKCAAVSLETFNSAQLFSDLTSLLTLRFLYAYSPSAIDLLTLLTIIRPNELNDRLPDIKLERFGKLVSNPGEFLSKYYFGSEGLISLKTAKDADKVADFLLYRIGNVLKHLSFGTTYIRDPRFSLSHSSGVANRMLVTQIPLQASNSGAGLILSLRSLEEGGAGVILIPFGTLLFDCEISKWLITVKTSATVQGFLIDSESIKFSENEVTQEFNIIFSVLKKLSSDKAAFQTSKSGTRFEIEQIEFGGEGIFKKESLEIDIAVNIKSAKIIVEGGNNDGFLQKILPKDGIHIDFDLTIGWSNKKGLYFSGGAGLETTLPINKQLLDVLLINSVYLAIIAKESGIHVAAAASVTIKLGPVVVAIEKMGLALNVAFPEKGGNLGPVNLELGFKPPTGAGLVIDASAVVGAGFLEFDPDKQMYSGFVYLEIVKKISVTAVGLITTRMPDGSPGFSLLALIAVQFSPAIQLGYGFTLNGLGGILGINRTSNIEALRTGLRNGTLGSILFPADPKKNIARIISDLKSVFPPAEGRFVFGPMVMLGWGPNALIKLELGVILELPDPIRLIILGRLSLKLPEEKKFVIKLKLDSLGVIDFGTGDISLDAVLYDSEIKGFTITGDMALRANFGSKPIFILSIGGFHPAFKVPAGFPVLQRVAISLATGDNPRFRLTAYMAITTNTFQFGAALEIYAKAGEFSLEGQLSFDALIQFDPFGLTVGMGAMVAIKLGSLVLFCVKLDINLAGPSPWHVWGEALFVFLGIPARIPFDETIGEHLEIPPPNPVDLLPMIVEALKQPANWATQLPLSENPLVAFREGITGEKGLLVHPLAMLQVSQRIAPLEQDLYKFGNAPLPGGKQKFVLTASASTHDAEPIKDWFAPSHFIDMSDDEKLSADSFEEKIAGIRFAQDGYIHGGFIEEDSLTYETSTDETASTTPATQTTGNTNIIVSPLTALNAHALTHNFLQQVASTGAAAQSLLKKTGNAKFQVVKPTSVATPVFDLKPRSFAVANDIAYVLGAEPTQLPQMQVLQSYTAAFAFAKTEFPAFPFNSYFTGRPKIFSVVEGVFIK